MHRIRFVFLFLFAIATAACSASAAGGSSSSARRASLNGPITRAQIQESSAANALDLVRSLRPQWLRPRGGSRVGQGADEVAVYLNNVRLGGPAQLRDLGTSQVQSLEYMDARRAQLRFGTGHEGGVILVTSRS